jgi:hypothetical protein
MTTTNTSSKEMLSTPSFVWRIIRYDWWNFHRPLVLVHCWFRLAGRAGIDRQTDLRYDQRRDPSRCR